MLVDTLKRHREQFAVGLLVVMVLWLIQCFVRLFQAFDAVGFANGSAMSAGMFVDPVFIAAVFAAIALVIGFGEHSRNARAVVLTALSLGVLALLFDFICWCGGFGADEQFASFPWGFGGTTSHIFGGLAPMVFLALVCWFGVHALQSLPRPTMTHAQWGQPSGGWVQQTDQSGQSGGYGQYAETGGQTPAAGPAQQQPQGWVQQAGPTDWGPQEPTASVHGWGQPPAETPQGWGPEPQQPSWSEPSAAPEPAEAAHTWQASEQSEPQPRSTHVAQAVDSAETDPPPVAAASDEPDADPEPSQRPQAGWWSRPPE